MVSILYLWIRALELLELEIVFSCAFWHFVYIALPLRQNPNQNYKTASLFSLCLRLFVYLLLGLPIAIHPRAPANHRPAQSKYTATDRPTKPILCCACFVALFSGFPFQYLPRHLATNNSRYVFTCVVPSFSCAVLCAYHFVWFCVRCSPCSALGATFSQRLSSKWLKIYIALKINSFLRVRRYRFAGILSLIAALWLLIVAPCGV